jgi:hypothetical protein
MPERQEGDPDVRADAKFYPTSSSSHSQHRPNCYCAALLSAIPTRPLINRTSKKLARIPIDRLHIGFGRYRNVGSPPRTTAWRGSRR